MTTFQRPNERPASPSLRPRRQYGRPLIHRPQRSTIENPRPSSLPPGPPQHPQNRQPQGRPASVHPKRPWLQLKTLSNPPRNLLGRVSWNLLIRRLSKVGRWCESIRRMTIASSLPPNSSKISRTIVISWSKPPEARRGCPTLPSRSGSNSAGATFPC